MFTILISLPYGFYVVCLFILFALLLRILWRRFMRPDK